MNVCKALEELVNEGVQKGIEKGIEEGVQQGRVEGIQALIRTCKRFHINKKIVTDSIAKEFSISKEKASEYVRRFW